MTVVSLSLLSHTNVGKTTLARTLLARDVGEVRDAPHVTEFADRHALVETAAGDQLLLWDTPGFGDSARLVRRMRQSEQPLGWVLTEIWDRWRDRAFWSTQQALRHVKTESDVLLYLVNASEPDAGYLAPEMELLGWVAKPVLVLLNQLGPPRTAAEEAAELRQWRERLARWPHVAEVLPLDAFARCWVHERTLLDAVQRALDGPARDAMARLAAAWSAAREMQFARSIEVLAASVGRLAAAREPLEGSGGVGERLREFGARLLRDEARDPASAAQALLARALDAEVRASTAELLALHGLTSGAPDRGAGRAPGGGPGGEAVLDEILARVAGQVQQHRRVPEGRAAMLGGALTGALAGLKADLATGGLTLGGGLLAGGLLGALGAAGLARGINVVRGTGRSWAGWSAEAMPALVEAALLRYLAVAHFGRGRGEWVQGEAPPHWPEAVRTALAPHAAALGALWAGRSERFDNEGEGARLAAALAPVLAAAARATLAALYPAPAPAPPGGNNRRA